MKLEYKSGLLFVDMKIGYKGNNVLLKNVVVDTGAAHTIINPDSVYKLGIKAEADDYGIGGEHYSYRNNINSVSIGSDCIEDINIDFGIIDEEGYINWLLGLDVLLKLGITINLKELELYSS
ncbi:putative aspartyl protease [Clostridium saccharoperbutylacetonicum]|uniref:Putative aspartyl protease n=1 Tax=Clostridium saccharoperbutylacetonicum N1-4(HMT) TaxID=931276 RepID=M1MNM7_9CLOT|nr:aspartyl protease family protein [Clostridium saccharoperbutylacetonicum]AGF57793.1 putative aspartyl protease [Clostridium saccharoperbutylacetonicum N1-4(HMT)]NRT61438.1 putative aspartyl protease [Clostridium saccharoperbutylacetonicum]NSB24757.1 putative aspartyl protease [Clostridium saccharoperbutylacetonicum]NSB44130.1 putative aspartyl protease [Clostridium saccharoperbutylacetonicum]